MVLAGGRIAEGVQLVALSDTPENAIGYDPTVASSWAEPDLPPGPTIANAQSFVTAWSLNEPAVANWLWTASPTAVQQP